MNSLRMSAYWSFLIGMFCELMWAHSPEAVLCSVAIETQYLEAIRVIILAKPSVEVYSTVVVPKASTMLCSIVIYMVYRKEPFVL